MDSAFDAVFGRCISQDENIEPASSKSHKQNKTNLLDLSLLFPWQTLLSGCLMLTTLTLKSVGDDIDKQIEIVCNFIDESHRKSAIIAILKDVIPNYSRRMWTSICDAVEHAPSTGILLHLVVQLKHVLHHTTRHTIEILLDSFLEIINKMIPIAMYSYGQFSENVPKSLKNLSSPFFLASSVIKSCLAFPPLVGSSVSPTAAGYLPYLCSIGQNIIDSVAYICSTTWLVWHSVQGNLMKPDWMTGIPDATSHPVITARMSSKSSFLISSFAELSNTLSSYMEDLEEHFFSIHICTSLCGTIAAEVYSYLSGSTSDESLSNIFKNAKLQLNIISCISSILQLYGKVGVAFEMALSSNGSFDEIRGQATGIVCGVDFVGAVESYIASIAGDESLNIAPEVLVPVAGLLHDVGACLNGAMELFASLDETSEQYRAIVIGIESAPNIIMDSSRQSEKHAAAETPEPDKKRSRLSSYQRQKRLQEVKNPFVRAILNEAGRKANDAIEDDLSDLEDFIVADPDKNYDQFISDHFPLPDSDEEDSKSE